MKISFNVQGMTCAACSARVEKAASAVPGVASVAVNLLKNSMEVQLAADATVRARPASGLQVIVSPLVVNRSQTASTQSLGALSRPLSSALPPPKISAA